MLVQIKASGRELMCVYAIVSYGYGVCMGKYDGRTVGKYDGDLVALTGNTMSIGGSARVRSTRQLGL